jgi:hypothetical protein
MHSEKTDKQSHPEPVKKSAKKNTASRSAVNTFGAIPNAISATHFAETDYQHLSDSSVRTVSQQAYQLMADSRQVNSAATSQHPIQRSEASQLMSAGFYLEDNDRQPGENKMTVAGFLGILRVRITDMANSLLAEIGQTADSCPYIAYWFEHYAEMGALEVERAIQLFAPQTTGITSASEVINLVVEKARTSLQQHVAGGQLDPVDPEKPSELTKGGAAIQSINPPSEANASTPAQRKTNTTSPAGAQLKPASGNVAQFGKKATKGGAKIVRPGFVGSVKVMRQDAKSLHPTENIHMAHRLSWESIRDTIMTNDKAKITAMVENLTIPQRNFGDPKKGGVKKGDLSYYNAVVAFHKAHPSDLVGLAKLLNSSPYNLRPGDGQTNSSIGGGPDAHFDETQLNEPMTPQSKALLPSWTIDSSDFMTMSDFADWEANFYIEYVEPAIASAKRIT